MSEVPISEFTELPISRFKLKHGIIKTDRYAKTITQTCLLRSNYQFKTQNDLPTFVSEILVNPSSQIILAGERIRIYNQDWQSLQTLNAWGVFGAQMFHTRPHLIAALSRSGLQIWDTTRPLVPLDEAGGFPFAERLWLKFIATDPYNPWLLYCAVPTFRSGLPSVAKLDVREPLMNLKYFVCPLDSTKCNQIKAIQPYLNHYLFTAEDGHIINLWDSRFPNMKIVSGQYSEGVSCPSSNKGSFAALKIFNNQTLVAISGTESRDIVLWDVSSGTSLQSRLMYVERTTSFGNIPPARGRIQFDFLVNRCALVNLDSRGSLVMLDLNTHERINEQTLHSHMDGNSCRSKVVTLPNDQGIVVHAYGSTPAVYTTY